MSKGKILDALELAGDNKAYQKYLIILLSILWLSINCILLGQSYIYIDPVFTCESTGQKQVTQQDACPIIAQCTNIYPSTLTQYLKLYCGRQNERVAIQSVFAIGSFVGLILMNFLSDIKGRKFSTLISVGFMILGTILQILGGIFDATYLLIISQLVNGFGSYSLITLSYILLSDFCNNKYRQLGTIIINSSWGFSTMFLGYLYIININWLVFLIWVLGVPLILTAVAIFFILIQSPYILIRQNKKQQCIKQFAKICYFNKTQQKMKQIQEIVWKEKPISSQNQQGFRRVLSFVLKKQNLKPLILLTIVHSCAALYYYGVAFAMSQQGNGFGINMIIAGGVQLISFALMALFVTKMKRVRGIAGYYIIASLLCFLYLVPVIHQNYIASSCILGVSRFFSTIAYTLLACIEIETFSVQIQSTAAGLIQAISTVGFLTSPIIVDMANNFQIDPVVLICAIFLILGIWPNIFLKQTLPALSPTKQVDKTINSSNQILNNLLNSDQDQKQAIYSNTTASNNGSSTEINIDFGIN